MPLIDDLLLRSAASVEQNAVGSAINAAQYAVARSPAGQVLSRIGANIFPGAFGGNIAPDGWLARSLARPESLLNVDWEIQMPDGLDSSYVEEIAASFSDIAVSDGVFRAGQRYYYAEVEDIGSLSITFFEDRLMTSTNYCNNWKGRIRNPDGSRNFPSEYKRTITVWPMDNKGVRLAELRYIGCWPSKIPTVTWGSASTQRITHQVEFSVDRLEITILTSAAGGAPFGSLQDFMNGFASNVIGTGTSLLNSRITNTIGGAVGRMSGKLF